MAGGGVDALFGGEPSDPVPESLPASASPPISAAAEPRRVEPLEPRAKPESQLVQAAPWNLSVDIAGFGAVGQLPGARVGLAGYIELDWPRVWPIEIGARIFREGSVNAPSPDQGRSRFELLLASIVTCPWSPAWLPGFGVCTGVEAGRLRAVASTACVATTQRKQC